MKQRRIAKTLILSVLPPAVLCLLYGLWLLLGNAGSLLEILYALLLLVLFIAVYVFSAWDAAERLRRADMLENEGLTRERKLDLREMVRITFVILCVRMLFFALSYASELLFNGYSGTVFDIQHIWADHPLATRYISMANRGYSWETGGAGVYANLSVAPLFGLMVRFFSPSASSSIKIAFLLANINCVLSGSALYALAVKEADRRRARWAVCFFCLLPSSFLMSCTLGDSTFLLLSLLTCFAVRQRVFFAAAGFGFFAALAAPQGVALLVPAAFAYAAYLREKLHEEKEKQSLFVLIGEGVSLLLIPAGLLLYMYKNKTVSGNPFMFIRLSGGYSLFFEQGASLLRSVTAVDRHTLLAEVLPALFALPGALLLLLVTAKNLPAGLRLYALSYILCIPNAGTAWPRLLFTCFPVIFAAAELASRKKRYAIPMLFFSTVLVLLRLCMFTLGWGAS